MKGQRKFDSHPVGLLGCEHGGGGGSQTWRGGMCLQTVCKVEEQGRYLDNEAWYILLPRRVEQKGRNKKKS